MKIKKLLIVAIFSWPLFLLMFSAILIADIPEKQQFETIMGRISKVDKENKTFKIKEQALVITKHSMNAVSNKKLKVNSLKEGMGAYVRYNQNNNNVIEFWHIPNIEDEFDLHNFIYIQEKRKGEVKNAVNIGDYDIMDISEDSQLHVIINTDYLKEIFNTIENDPNEDLIIQAKAELKEGKPDILNLDERKYNLFELSDSFADPFILYADEAGLKEGAKIKVRAYSKKRNTEAENITRHREIKLKIKKYGFHVYPLDLIAFTRDSFSKTWKPTPGTTMEAGYTFRETARYKKILNFFGVRGGMHLLLLDFDEDQNIEYGFGINGSLFNGQITLGYGWNVSTARRSKTYAFFGISITHIVEMVRASLK